MWLLLLAFGVAFGASAGRPERARADRHRVLLWHAYSGAEQEALERAVAAFERAHPDIDVTLLANAYGAYASKLESAVPTGNGPDLFIDAHERLSSYRERGVVAPFGDLGSLEGGFEEAHLDALRSGEGAERELFGLPFTLKCAALFVNTDLIPEPVEELEELERLAPGAGLPEGTVPLVMEADNAYYVAALLHAYGGRMLDDRGRYAFTGRAAERTVERVRGWTEAGILPSEPSFDLLKRLFGGGRAAAAITGPWLAPDLPASLHWRVQPLPVSRDAGGARLRPYLTVEALFLTPGARDPEAARTLARYLAGPEAARVRALEGRQVVALRAAWEDPRIASDPFLVAFREAAAEAIPLPTHPHMRAVFVPAQRALRRVLRGGMTPREALEDGARRFASDVRPPPPRQDPLWAVLAIGALLLAAALLMVRRAREPSFRLALRRSLPVYAYLLHAVVAVGLLVILPLVVGALTSFFAGRGADLHYVGLANYIDILTAQGGPLLASGSFWVVLLVTLLWTALNLLLHVSIGVALALLLSLPKLRFKGLYRVLLIVPWAVPSYVTALAWKGMFHRQFGAINAILEALGFEPISFFARFTTAFAANVATNTWLGFPFMMVVTLGALTAIPSDLYEAAAVDGATRWQRFRHITLPLLVPSLMPAVAMGAVWTFNMFNVVFLVSGGEPAGSTEILVSEAYRWAFTRSQQYGYAAAYAVLIFVLLFFGTRLLGRLSGGEGEKKKEAEA